MQKSKTATGRREPSAEQPLQGLVIGRVATVDPLGSATVEHSGASSAQPALTTVRLREEDIGRKVALAFEGGLLDRPIIIGLIHEPLAALMTPGGSPKGEDRREVRVDDERMVLSAEREIVLRCGKASITLYKDGRVLVRGTNIVSRSSGPNRIKGASIQLN